MKKISIVIPNYNNEKFIEKCLTSVISQDYPKKEIIIIDDGSTDSSVQVIEETIRKHKKIPIKLVWQNHLNAAVARNRGIQIATGSYIMFLDSDDVLETGSIRRLVDAMETTKSDLVIGGYYEMDLSGKNKRIKFSPSADKLYTKGDLFTKLVNVPPVPSNKLYRMEVIRNNNISWGDVKIGQDLNFYLKFLLKANTVSLIKQNVFSYRINDGSISRSYDLRIFDIAKSFEDVKKYYIQNNSLDLYESYLSVQELKHYDYQMCKQIYFKDKKTRRKVVSFFDDLEKKIDYNKSQNFDDVAKKIRNRYRQKCKLKMIYTSDWYVSWKKKRQG